MAESNYNITVNSNFLVIVCQPILFLCLYDHFMANMNMTGGYRSAGSQADDEWATKRESAN